MSVFRRLGPVVSLGFGLILLLTIGIGVLSQQTINRVSETEKWVDHTYNVKGTLNALLASFLNIQTGIRGYVITGQNAYLDPYNQGRAELKENLNALKQLVKDIPEQVETLKSIEALSREWEAFSGAVVSARRTEGEPRAKALVLTGRGKQTMDAIRKSISEMVRVEQDLLKKREAAAERALAWAYRFTYGGIAAAFLIGLALLSTVQRSAIRPIQEVTNSLAASAVQIAATVEEQDRIATQQAASVNETSATMDELGTSFLATSGQADSAAGEARQSLTLVEAGNTAVEETHAAMATLKERVDAIAGQILLLSEQTSQIGTVTDLMSDLASQTNLLALNAAVEAARAGEHGRGFNVVATEIRKLADESKKSAERIRALVEEIQKATNATVMATEEGTKTVGKGMEIARETGVTFDNLAASARSSFQSIQQITLNVKQQASAVTQVVEAMNSLNAGAKENAAGIAQTKVTVDLLNESAQRLKRIV